MSRTSIMITDSVLHVSMPYVKYRTSGMDDFEADSRLHFGGK